MDIFFYEAFDEEERALRRHLPDGVEAGFTWKTVQEHLEGETVDGPPPAPLISVRTQSEIPTDWATELEGIISRSTGYDHVQRYRAVSGVAVPAGYLPHYCARAVAEQALLLWMALLRRLPRQSDAFFTFTRDALTGRETEGRTLAVYGVGAIGSEVVRIGRGLGMTVLGVDIDPRHEGVDYVEPVDAMQRADVIVCAMNLTPDNVAYFDRALLEHAKQGAVFVNVSRGELSPPGPLAEAVTQGRLGGVALDVFDHESELGVALRDGRPSDDPVVTALLELSKRPEVICTPHNAFNTEEAVERKSADSAAQLAHFRAEGAFKWPVPAA